MRFGKPLQGQAGVPSRNDRLMDELQQRGLAVPNAEQRAVWTCEVRVGEGDESWCQTLTLLRIPLDRLWPDRRGAPAIGRRVGPRSRGGGNAVGRRDAGWQSDD